MLNWIIRRIRIITIGSYSLRLWIRVHEYNQYVTNMPEMLYRHYCAQNAVYQRFIYMYDITAGPHKAFLLKKNFQFTVVCLQSYQVPTFQVSSSLSATAAICSIPRYEQKCFVWPCIELLWLCLSTQFILPSQ